eukprot:2121510-Rhodomonas_salina.1
MLQTASSSRPFAESVTLGCGSSGFSPECATRGIPAASALEGREGGGRGLLFMCWREFSGASMRFHKFSSNEIGLVVSCACVSRNDVGYVGSRTGRRAWFYPLSACAHARQCPALTSRVVVLGVDGRGRGNGGRDTNDR